MPWDGAEEVTFECEPGTLQKPSSRPSADRRHAAQPRRRELRRPRSSSSTAGRTARRRSTAPTSWARELGFPQINIDLIAGMVGETETTGGVCVEKTIELAARQRHHLPDGAAVQHDDRQPAEGHRPFASRWPTGPTKRRWVRDAFEALEAPATRVRSAYTPSRIRAHEFVYRDACGRAPTCSASAWRRSGTSTASTCRTSTRGRPTPPPIDGRDPAQPRVSADARGALIREFILQLKLGSIGRRISATSIRSTSSSVPRAARFDSRRRLPRRAPRTACSHARRAAAGRRLLPRFFLPEARRDSLHVRGHSRGGGGRGRWGERGPA